MLPNIIGAVFLAAFILFIVNEFIREYRRADISSALLHAINRASEEGMFMIGLSMFILVTLAMWHLTFS